MRTKSFFEQQTFYYQNRPVDTLIDNTYFLTLTQAIKEDTFPENFQMNYGVEDAEKQPVSNEAKNELLTLMLEKAKALDTEDTDQAGKFVELTEYFLAKTEIDNTFRTSTELSNEIQGLRNLINGLSIQPALAELEIKKRRVWILGLFLFFCATPAVLALTMVLPSFYAGFLLTLVAVGTIGSFVVHCETANQINNVYENIAQHNDQISEKEKDRESSLAGLKQANACLERTNHDIMDYKFTDPMTLFDNADHDLNQHDSSEYESSHYVSSEDSKDEESSKHADATDMSSGVPGDVVGQQSELPNKSIFGSNEKFCRSSGASLNPSVTLPGAGFGFRS